VRSKAVLAAVAVVASCSRGVAGPAAPSTAPTPQASSTPTVTRTTPPATVATTTIPTIATSSTFAPTTAMTDAGHSGLDGISMTSVPPDVIVPTSDASLDKITNPINGRRGGRRPRAAALDCVAETAAGDTCLTGMLDTLGFDVTSGSSDDRERRVERATAVVRLDAGLPRTGESDDALARYLGIAAGATLEARAAETRQIGTSAQGRPITAVRYGDGSKTVLVVGQTHGDEEGGLRVLLRARSLPLPDGITMWVVPTMNPDGLVADTRFLADGADPNRRAPSEPEQLAVYIFALAVRPSLTIWYHQNYGWVGGSGASLAAAQRYQALTELGTLKRSGDCAVGFMWCPIDDALGSSSILVELPDVLTPAEVQAHAQALLAVAAS
jgi:murein peptide amidase A